MKTRNLDIVPFSTDIRKGFFVSVPFNTIVDQCEIIEKINLWNLMVCYGSKNEIPSFIQVILPTIKSPTAIYKIVSLSHNIQEITIFKELGITYKEYIKMLYKKDITVNYSDYSNFWLMVVLQNKNIK